MRCSISCSFFVVILLLDFSYLFSLCFCSTDILRYIFLAYPFFLSFYSSDNPLYWSKAIFFTFLYFLHNTVHPCLCTFHYFCMVPSQQAFLVLQDTIKTSWWRLQSNNVSSFNTSSRRLQDIFAKCL